MVVIANAIDLTRFLNAVGGSSGTQLLAPATVATMVARPDLAQWQGKDQFYALGWVVMLGRVEMTHSRSQIEVFYLPAYSPELNPDEGLNGSLQQAVPRMPKGGAVADRTPVARRLGSMA